MDIQRIDNYTDTRFSKNVLEPHGAYLIDGDPYEIEITGSSEATVRGKDPAAYAELIEEFRFHAPHITRFFDEAGSLLAEYPVPEIIEVEIDRIQPSQFFVDEEKLAAIRPASVGQASRISGVSPSDVAVLLIYLQTKKDSGE